MSEVKRYAMIEVGLSYHKRTEMESDEDGSWVYFEDYAALQRKLDAVLAENVALKESRKRLGEFIVEEIDAGYPLNMEVQTPATDAILNAVRAEGLQKFAKIADEKAKVFDESARAAVDFTEDQRFRFAAAMFRGLSRQLRAGNSEGGE